MERDAVVVVVVGAGTAGGAPAYVPSRRGARSVAVERGPVPGELIVDGKPSLDIAGIRFSRFVEGAVGKPRNVR